MALLCSRLLLISVNGLHHNGRAYTENTPQSPQILLADSSIPSHTISELVECHNNHRESRFCTSIQHSRLPAASGPESWTPQLRSLAIDRQENHFSEKTTLKTLKARPAHRLQHLQHLQHLESITSIALLEGQG